MKLVLVEWEDASTDNNDSAWIFTAGLAPIPRKVFRQVGWLYRDTPDEVELTSAVDEGAEMIARRDRIPRGMVRSITELQPAPKRKR